MPRRLARPARAPHPPGSVRFDTGLLAGPVLALLLPALALGATTAACRGEPAPSAKPLPRPDLSGPLLREGPLSPRIASYRIEARLDPNRRLIEATQRLSWRNTAEREVDEVPLHLYMNAFKNEMSLFMRESRGSHRGEKASRDEWGWIEVSSIRLEEEELRGRARHVGPDETVLEVPLPAPVPPGGYLHLDFQFTVKLPRAFARTGFVDEFHLVAQWFPKIGVLTGEPGEERWHCAPFHPHSEFFADFGVYDVTLTVPETYVVAATGVLTAADDRGEGTRTLRYRAEDVHDFAWVADPYLESIAGEAHTPLGPIEVRVYHRPRQREFAERHLRAGVGAVEVFSRDYLPYPYPIMTIVDPPPEAAGSTGGMEYPTFVTTAGDSVLTPDGVRFPEMITIHEVGHNWFQGMLASNEVDEAWLDEGVNQYAVGLVLEELYGGLIDFGGYTADYFEMQRAGIDRLANLPDPIATHSHAFADYSSYGMATYAKTALLLRSLQRLVGREKLREVLASYARSFAFRHPTGADLFDTLERELGEDLGWLVDPGFHRRGVADLRVRSVNCRRAREPRGVFGAGEERQIVGEEDQSDENRPHACDILVESLGEVKPPVDVEIRFADGSRIRERWDGRGRWHRFSVERVAPVESVILDPAHDLLLRDGMLESGYRRIPRRGASMRAAARGHFWLQSLMQGLGP